MDDEGNTQAPVNQEILPSGFKDTLPEYLPGPIKIYNDEEIEEYMRERHDKFTTIPK